MHVRVHVCIYFCLPILIGLFFSLQSVLFPSPPLLYSPTKPAPFHPQQPRLRRTNNQRRAAMDATWAGESNQQQSNFRPVLVATISPVICSERSCCSALCPRPWLQKLVPKFSQEPSRPGQGSLPHSYCPHPPCPAV